MLRKLVRRHNPPFLTFLAVLVCVPAALVLLWVFDMLLKGYVPWVDLVITVLIASILGSLICYALFVMIKKLDDAEGRLEALAHQDALTGLCNRRYFEQLACEEIQRATRYNAPMAVVMVDVDHFKRVNDTHGHTAGDVVIKGIATELRQALRRLDTICRYGGEEFICLLPQTTREEAALMAERMRLGVAALRIAIGSADIVQVTASFGVAELDPDQSDLNDLVQRADANLYKAKNAGRNQVCA